MSAPLALSVAYQAYPAGVVAAHGYHDYYWPSPEEEDREEEEEEEMEPVQSSKGLLAEEAFSSLEDKPSHRKADLSPISSSSGMLNHYTPDSATSPNKQPPSPQLISIPQKKGKTRTAFSQEQLQILHHRFQSQKYLSPQQIRELGCALGLTYKQVKTWFQNQRMKFKRTQKETVWMKKAICPSQNGFQQAGYLDINPGYHQGYALNAARNIHSLANVHDNYGNNQNYGNHPSYSNDHNQIYGAPQSFYPIVSGEDGSFFATPSGACYGQQAISYISQQKMNIYRGFSASVEYAAVKMEDSFPFPNISATPAAFPSSSVLQHYDMSLQNSGAQSSCNS